MRYAIITLFLLITAIVALLPFAAFARGEPLRWIYPKYLTPAEISCQALGIPLSARAFNGRRPRCFVGFDS